MVEISGEWADKKLCLKLGQIRIQVTWNTFSDGDIDDRMIRRELLSSPGGVCGRKDPATVFHSGSLCLPGIRCSQPLSGHSRQDPHKDELWPP